MRLVAVKRQMKWMEVANPKKEHSNTPAVLHPSQSDGNIDILGDLFFETFRFGDFWLSFFWEVQEKTCVYIMGFEFPQGTRT